MSEGGGGFNHNLWSQQNLGKQVNAEDFKANEDESPQIWVGGLNKWLYIAIKMVGAIPFIGPLLSVIFPANPGTVGVFAGLDSEGFGSKPINQKGGSFLDMSGGVIVKTAGDLIKNSSIPGGNPYGDGSAGSGDGGGWGGGGGSEGGGGSGGGSGNFSSYESSFSGMDSAPIIAAGGGNRFEWHTEPLESLGFLRPMATPNITGPGMGAGMELG